MADNNRSTSILLLALLAVIWGSSFILMKKGLEVYSWDQVGAIRMLISLVVLVPFIWNKSGSIEKHRWKYIATAGWCGNLIPAFLFPLAETRIDSGLAGILNSLTPLFTLFIGFVFFGMPLSRNRVGGVFIGLAGACLIILGKPKATFSGDVGYSFFIVLATIFYATSVNVLRHRLRDIPALILTGFCLLFAGIPAGIYLFTTDFIQRTQHTEGAMTSLSAILTLGIFGTAVSTVLFTRLIKISSALLASSVTYLIPFVAILWGIAAGEKLTVLNLLGFGAILSGVYLINRKIN